MRSRLFIALMFLLISLAGLFLFTQIILSKRHLVAIELQPRTIPLSSEDSISVVVENAKENLVLDATSSAPITIENPNSLPPKFNLDIEPQPPLANPPEIIKAVYATSWSAGSSKKMKYLIDLIKATELNSIVIDIKDFSGYVAYQTEIDLVKEYKAVEYRIPKINSLIKLLHDEGIYVIGRISVFQDPRLALARPDLALQSSSTRSVWKDKLGLAWIDPAAREAWDYNILIAREALSRGFDELNFDYIRFPSDGNLKDIIYPRADFSCSSQVENLTDCSSRQARRINILVEFFKYLREQLPGARLSADLFGLTTVNTDDLGIGQNLEKAFPYFDYIAPMVYPSHYQPGFIGYQNPAQHPYEVIKHSMERALKRLTTYNQKQTKSTSSEPSTNNLPPTISPGPSSVVNRESLVRAKFRPWLQDFDLGANYDAEMVRREIQAVYDAASGTPELLNGWMIWNPSNIYTREALQDE